MILLLFGFSPKPTKSLLCMAQTISSDDSLRLVISAESGREHLEVLNEEAKITWEFNDDEHEQEPAENWTTEM